MIYRAFDHYYTAIGVILGLYWSYIKKEYDVMRYYFYYNRYRIGRYNIGVSKKKNTTRKELAKVYGCYPDVRMEGRLILSGISPVWFIRAALQGSGLVSRPRGSGCRAGGLGLRA